MLKKISALIVSIAGVALILSTCTEIKYENPIDINGINKDKFLQNPNLLNDDDNDGIFNFRDPDSDFFEKDTAKPVIVLLGGDTVSIEYGDPESKLAYYIKQVTVTDNSGTAMELDVASNVDIYTITTDVLFTIKYQYIDSSQNIGTATRYVAIYKATDKDTKKPVITVGEPTFYLQVGSTFIDPGVSVYDIHDGAIPSSKVTVTGTVNNKVTGEYTLTYSVADAAGNIGTATRKVVVQEGPVGPDRTNPVITLTKPDTITIPSTVTLKDFIASYKDPGYTAMDNIDGNITAKVKVGIFTQLSAKVWYITYDVTDLAGNAAATVKRIILDPNGVVVTPPIIDLTYPDSTIQLVLPATGKAKWKEPGYAASDVTDGDLTSKVVVDSANLVANLGIKGIYTVTYTVTNSNNLKASKTRKVQVVANPYDVIPPVITLLGKNPDTVQVATSATATYKDPGYTAEDDHDGDVTSKVTVSGTVKMTAIGTYTLSYAVTDAANRVGRATRTVKVVKDTAAGNLFAAYGVPSETPLPDMNNLTFATVTSDGDDLSAAKTAIKSLNINWSLTEKNLRGFAFQYNATPYYKEISKSVTHTFDQASPGMKIASSQVTGLDGEYYVAYNATKGEFIWVEKTGKFALIWTK